MTNGAVPDQRGSRVTLASHAAEAIRRWIIAGDLEPGEPLVEARLAKRVGMSRVPVREALQRLAEQGFVESQPGHSALVARRSGRDIVEMFAVRAVIEGLVCRLAAQDREERDLEVLDDSVEWGSAAAERVDWDEVARQNSVFHVELSRIAGNRHLEETVLSYRNRLAWLHGATAEMAGTRAWEQHREILEAVRSGDADAAERLGRQHVQTTSEIFARAYMDGRLRI